MSRSSFRHLIALLWLFGPAGTARADEPPVTDFRGPAEVRNERPYQLLFLDFTPQGGTTLGTGRSAMAVHLDVANDLMTPLPQRTTVIEDTETQRLSVAYRRGVGGRTEVGVQAFLIDRDGGVLDQLLQYYHELVGLTHASPDTPNGRHDLSFYHSTVFLRGTDGRVLVDARATAGMGDLSLFVKRSLVERPALAVAVRAGLKLPTGNAETLLGSGGTDGGLDMDATYRLSHRRALFADAGYVWMTKDTHIATAATHQFQYSAGLEWLIRSRASLVLQTAGGDRVVTTGNAHVDSHPSILTLAYRHQSNSHTVYTFAFGENGDIFEYHLSRIAGIGPDVTFSAGIEWQR